MQSKTVVEVQEMLGCKRTSVFKLLRNGVLERAERVPAGRSGRRETRITTKSVVDYIKGGRK